MKLVKQSFRLGLRCTIYTDQYGTKLYFRRDGSLHRENGPAVEYADGSKFWYRDGQCHREDGPAAEWASGVKSWFLNGKQYLEAEFNAAISAKASA
jgi:hypothetical protein